MVALITGASSGIGYSTAEKLMESGHQTILLARRHEPLEKLQKKFPQQVLNVMILDLANLSEVESVFKKYENTLEKVSLLVNNAGLALGVEKVDKSQFSDWQQMIDVNLRALMFITHFMVNSIKKNKGHIINIGSVAGRWVYPGGAAYCATKYAVRAFSEGLRLDLMGSGVRVTNIEPGMVETEFSKVRLGSQELADKVYENMTPLTARDIANTICWCIQQPMHVNVQEIVIFPTDQAGVGYVHRN